MQHRHALHRHLIAQLRTTSRALRRLRRDLGLSRAYERVVEDLCLTVSEKTQSD